MTAVGVPEGGIILTIDGREWALVPIEVLRGEVKYPTVDQIAGSFVQPSDDEEVAKALCPKCDGCGRIANTDREEPWTAWEELPPGSDIAVRMGMVKPIPCPACGGSGR